MRYYLIAFIFVLAVFFTNSLFDFQTGATILGQTDTATYRAVAISAPYAPDQVFPYHHLQRSFIPFIIGIFASTFSLDVDIIFRFVVIAVWILSVIVLVKFNIKNKISLGAFAVLAAVFIFHPYCGRYYMAVPFMLTDTVFVLGVALCSVGVATNKWAAVSVGLVVAALGRQTALPLAIVLWVGWFMLNRPSGARWLVAASVATVLLYIFGGKFADLSGAVNINIAHVVGLYDWAISNSPNKTKVLIEFFIRMMTGEILLFALLVPSLIIMRKHICRTDVILSMIVVSIWAQPILAGPEISGNNIVRLCALALPALYVLLSRFLSMLEVSSNSVYAICLLIFIASFHHRWTQFGKVFIKEPLNYAVLVYAVATIVLVIYYSSIRSRAEFDNKA